MTTLCLVLLISSIVHIVHSDWIDPFTPTLSSNVESLLRSKLHQSTSSLTHTQHSRLISTPLSTLHTGKHIVGPHLQFASMWGPTLYTNTISVPPMLTIGLLTHEPSKLPNATWTAASITLLLSSLVIGVAISYLGWRARSLVTATCYTVLGVANKMLTVLANAMVRAQHTHTQSVTPFSQNAC